MKKLAARLGLVLLGLALGLAALEVLLQVAAPVLRPTLRPLTVNENDSEVRILCVGDSHTYGIWVEPNETYPARLQQKLTSRARGIRVLNAGVPGMNSSQVRGAFPELLDRFRPAVVLMMVGVADFWNLDSFRAEEYRGWRWVGRGAGLWEQSRVVKLVRLLRFNLRWGRGPAPAGIPEVEHTPFNWKIKGGGEDIDVDIDMHFDDGLKDIVVFRRILRHDLADIAAEAEARGVTLVLMTYPTDAALYGAVNEVYRQFAHASGLPFIDLAEKLTSWSRPPFDQKTFFPDFHPRRAGYELVARAIAAALPIPPAREGRPASGPGPTRVRRSITSEGAR